MGTCPLVQRAGLGSWAQAGEAGGAGRLQTPLVDPYGSQRARRGCVFEFSLKRWLQPGGWTASGRWVTPGGQGPRAVPGPLTDWPGPGLNLHRSSDDAEGSSSCRGCPVTSHKQQEVTGFCWSVDVGF